MSVTGVEIRAGHVKRGETACASPKAGLGLRKLSTCCSALVRCVGNSENNNKRNDTCSESSLRRGSCTGLCTIKRLGMCR